ncbi:hypothetical protein [Rhodococcus sp. Q]|uniref:hypothetical protein n=1 Tax=Rhodococcus sp. Q TaxID=2502252 RepID=UPI0010F5A35A|nr:hypothetical protein [Rhodococcus sp. Q]
MSDYTVVYEIARYHDDGDRLVERFEVLSDGTSVRRRGDDGSMTHLHGDTAAQAIAADPDLCEIRAGELTRVTTTALVDELPLILRASGTYPDQDSDADGEDAYEDFGGCVAVYDDRKVEVNGHRWFVFSGYLLPTERASASLTETWADMECDTGSTPFSDGVVRGVIGLLNPSVVVSIAPSWEGSGHVVSVGRRGSDAYALLGWLLCFRPEDWAAGSGTDSERILAQLFIEASKTLGERTGVSGDQLAAGIVEDNFSFGVAAGWDLTLNITPDVVEKVLDRLAEDEEFADLVAAARDPESKAAPRAR